MAPITCHRVFTLLEINKLLYSKLRYEKANSKKTLPEKIFL